MLTATRSLPTVALMLSLFVSLLLGSTLLTFGASAARTINLPETGNYTFTGDDDEDGPEEPDVKARVARISFLRGSAKVRHAGEKDWEKVTLNLPIVEGDEVVTDQDSRIEIQFDKSQHLRLEENSYLKVATLKDEGIAVSINIGTMNVRITSFDKDHSFFEIDAPKTTIAVQKSGSYRVDAGREGSTEVRSTVAAGGEARVYSDTAGFVLKSGKSASIVIDGANAGDWSQADAQKYADEFDAWAADRDDVIAKRLKSAYYGSYYDDDIYGADDLSDNGQWVYTRDYGYIWQPYQRVIVQYVDWSPYRYGHWRYTPPFGWVWVNDEPWGWATYHHGRWIYYNGGWAWTPYGYYRPARSWWFPALVAINISFNNYCWYPLGYHHHYQHYNHHNGNWNGGHGPRDPRDPRDPRSPVASNSKHPADFIPPTSVVAVDTKNFGSITGPTRKLPENDAKHLLAANNTGTQQQPTLPAIGDVKKLLGREVVAQNPNIPTNVRPVGATDRKGGGPLDDDLLNRRMYGGRDPIRNAPGGIIVGDGRGTGIGAANGTGIGAGNGTGIGAANGSGIGNGSTRKTGVFDRDNPNSAPTRDPIKVAPSGGSSDPIKVAPPRQDDPIKVDPRGNNGSGNPDDRKTRNNPPIRVEPPRGSDPIRVEPPRNDPPRETRQPPRENAAPIRVEPPRNDPPRETKQPVRDNPAPVKVERPPDKQPEKAPPPKQDTPAKPPEDAPKVGKIKPDGSR